MNICIECGDTTEKEECVCGGKCVDLETLSDLAHRLWWHWSEYIALEESISQDRLTRWQDLWVDYTELTEEMKDKDREVVEEQLRNKRHPEEKWDNRNNE